MLQNLCGNLIVVTFNYFFMELVGTVSRECTVIKFRSDSYAKLSTLFESTKNLF